MQFAEYKNIYKNEGTHFYYLVNHKIILALINKYLHNKRNLKILDAGCGSGLLAKKLETFGSVVGIDISSEALKYAKKRKLNVKKASVSKLSFTDNTFDLVVSIDVIYHQAVKDDIKALAEFKRVLKKDGILILRVPANKFLQRSSDQHVQTRERYSRSELEKKLIKAGFKVQKITPVNMFLLPAAILEAIWEKIKKPQKTKSPLTNLNPVLNNLVAKLLSLETNFIIKYNLPFGLGLVAVCKK